MIKNKQLVLSDIKNKRNLDTMPKKRKRDDNRENKKKIRLDDTVVTKKNMKTSQHLTAKSSSKQTAEANVKLSDSKEIGMIVGNGTFKKSKTDSDTNKTIAKKNNRKRRKVTAMISSSKQNAKTDSKPLDGRKKVDIDPKTKLKIPQKLDEVSSNWKQMQEKICQPASKSRANPKKQKAKKSRQKEKKGEITDTAAKTAEQRPAIWFHGVDPCLLEDLDPAEKVVNESVTLEALDPAKEAESKLVKGRSFAGVTRAVAMDCEMVGVGEDGVESILARVSMVNHFGNCIYDTFVQAREKVTDYRTHVSGVRPQDVANGKEFSEVQKDVANILKGRILVGHALENDLQVLYLDHPHKMIRDTQRYKPFKHMFGGRRPGLKRLTAKVLDVDVQHGEHSSVQDSQAAMRLYTMHKKEWEKALSLKYPKGTKRLKRKVGSSKKTTVTLLDLDT